MTPDMSPAARYRQKVIASKAQRPQQVQPSPEMLARQERTGQPHPFLPPVVRQAMDRVNPAMQFLANELLHGMDMQGEAADEAGARATDAVSPYVPAQIAGAVGTGAKLVVEMLGGPGSAGKAMVGYHGSPHRWRPEPGFPQGRPRLDKIGTGEGYAAQGWGFYSAERPGVGQHYKDVLSTKAGAESGARYTLDIPDDDIARYMDWDAPLKDQPQSVKDALKRISVPPTQVEDLPREELIRMLQRVDPNGTYSDADNLAEFGDVATTKELREAAKQIDLQDYLNQNAPRWSGGETGESLYHWLTTKFGGGGFEGSNEAQRKASEALRDAGIPGLRYLDRTSRDARARAVTPNWRTYDGERTRNFVTWDQGVLDRAKVLAVE
jgi:hypothetical protein